MRPFPCLLFAPALVLLLGGCSLAQLYHRPETPTPANWIDEAKTGDAALSPDWWRQFNSPELTTLMGDLQSSNLDLAAAAARVREATAQTRIGGAPLYPTVSGAGNVNRSVNPAGGSHGSAVTSASVDIEASYEVDFWGKNAASLAAAKASEQASRYDQQVVILTAEATLADDYFDYLSSLDRAAVARRNLAAAEAIRDAYRDQVAEGVSTSVDLAQQENVVASTEAAIPIQEQEARQDLIAIAILVGKTPDAITLGGSTLEGLATPTPSPGLPSQLLMRRPDVSEAEENLVAANADIAVARAAFFPSLSLTGQGGYSSGALSTLFQPGNLLLSAGASLTQPIFNGGALQGQLDYNRARYDELVADYRKSVLSAFSDVETALVAVQKTDEEERDQDRVVTTARDAYQLVQDQLKGGVANVTSVLDTQRSLFQAEDSQLQSRLNHLEAAIALFKALGGGWQTSKE